MQQHSQIDVLVEVAGRAPSPGPEDQSAQVRAVSWLVLWYKRQQHCSVALDHATGLSPQQPETNHLGFNILFRALVQTKLKYKHKVASYFSWCLSFPALMKSLHELCFCVSLSMRLSPCVSVSVSLLRQLCSLNKRQQLRINQLTPLICADWSSGPGEGALPATSTFL